MLFNVMISRFFTKKQRERENREKKSGKTGNGDDLGVFQTQTV
jgi:hypothetical protein